MAGTVTFDEFFTEVIPYVRDCPEFVAINAIRNACIEFCEKSLYWRETFDNIPLVAGTSVYDLDPGWTGSAVAQILSVGIGWRNITPASPEKIKLVIGADWRNQSGPVEYYLQEDATQITLVRTPDGSDTDAMAITVALRPTRTATKVDADVYQRYAEIIGFGARARLHDTPGQPYTDPESAMKFRKWFETGYGEAKIAANRALTRGPLMVRPPRTI